MSDTTLALHRTTIGKKAVMAVTGIVLMAFVLGHMLGNLQLYAGKAAINGYAHLLHSTHGLIWVVRAVLLLCVALHAWAAIALYFANKAARPIAYQKPTQDAATTYAAKTMIWGGVILALFILYHLAHLTLGVGAPGTFSEHDVYNNVVSGFQVPWLSALYIVAQLALALHIYHGAWSFMQTLGFNHPRYNLLRKQFAIAFAVLIAIGNISLPVSVLAGLVE